jgi:ribonuclease D
MGSSRHTTTRQKPLIRLPFQVMLRYQVKTEIDLDQVQIQGVGALDLEMANWRVPSQEWISLVQIAYREAGEIHVVVLDGKDAQTPETVQPFLLNPNIKIAVHNAAYDVNKLQKHWGIHTQSAFCTMNAARRAGEKKYSLQVLAKKFLGIELDKSEQTSDFSQRPLKPEQIEYAAKDAACTLLLWEYQQQAGWNSPYQAKLKSERAAKAQSATLASKAPGFAFPTETSKLCAAILEVIGFMPHKFSPERLITNITTERSGYLGWVLDGKLGTDVIPDEKEVLEALATLESTGQVQVIERRYVLA